MALSSSELSWLRRKVGSSPSDAELQTMYAELGDVKEVAAQIVETRLADVAASPTSMSFDGDFSLSNSGRAKVLRDQLRGLDDVGGHDVVTIVKPARRRTR